MSELTTTPSEQTAKRRGGATWLLWALIPLLLLGGLLAMLVVTGAGLGARTAPPIEELTVDRITLPERGQIVVELTNGGADPVTVAQVQVDDAYWEFDITPNATIPRLGQATITIPYPWVQD
jgi:ZIP family zinc transporter